MWKILISVSQFYSETSKWKLTVLFIHSDTVCKMLKKSSEEVTQWYDILPRKYIYD